MIMFCIKLLNKHEVVLFVLHDLAQGDRSGIPLACLHVAGMMQLEVCSQTAGRTEPLAFYYQLIQSFPTHTCTLLVKAMCMGSAEWRAETDVLSFSCPWLGKWVVWEGRTGEELMSSCWKMFIDALIRVSCSVRSLAQLKPDPVVQTLLLFVSCCPLQF